MCILLTLLKAQYNLTDVESTIEPENYVPTTFLSCGMVTTLQVVFICTLCVYVHVICMMYCKTLNVGVPFILQISEAKQNREIKWHQYGLYSNSN